MELEHQTKETPIFWPNLFVAGAAIVQFFAFILRLLSFNFIF